MIALNPMANVTLRLLASTDSVNSLTGLLHRAYAQLGAMGLNYTAVDQSPEATRRRIAGHECYVAEQEGRIVGTVALQIDQRERPTCARHRDMAYFSQFAVEPHVQGRGIGTRLLGHIESRASQLGFRRLALDTAVPATDLIAYYATRGYLSIGVEHFPGKTYASIIMAKALSTKRVETAN